MLKMLTTPAPPISSVASHVSEPICQVVDRALAFSPSDRYPDAETMRRDLAEARAGRAPPFAIAVPASNHDRATVARTPQAIGNTVLETPSPPPKPSGANTPSAQPDERDRRKLIAVILVGTLVGAIATTLVIRSLSSDAGETETASATSVDKEPRTRRKRRARVDAPESSSGSDAEPASASGSASVSEPEPAPGSASASASDPDPDPAPAPAPDPDPAPAPAPAPDPAPAPRARSSAARWARTSASSPGQPPSR